MNTRRRHAIGATRSRGWVDRSFLRTLVDLIPTANGIVLVVQAVLAQAPYDTALPPLVYVCVNAAVILFAALLRISAILLDNPVVSAWLGRAAPVEPTAAGNSPIVQSEEGAA